ncbi:DUF4283 domain-containing protein, partial [Solirubrobacter sp. CPCC 204708]|nr:DUF4283 domain-containing protein [Solirubrobacter deserti]
VIKRWHLGMTLEKEYFSKIPVWIKLKNLPIVLRSIEGLEFIGSTLGNPLYVDLDNLARICVEIDADKEIPDSMLFDLGKGVASEIFFEIPWKPSRCGRCKVFGHSSLKCPLGHPVIQRQVWKVKKSAPSAPKGNPQAGSFVAPKGNPQAGSIVESYSKERDPFPPKDVSVICNDPKEWIEVSNNKVKSSSSKIVE